VTRVGAVVLAAGRSARFRAAGGPGATKLVAKLGDKPIVRMAAEAALASRARPVIVVTGHARASVEAALAGLDVEWAHNPQFSSGLASSLRVGLAAMPADVAGALVLLGDMPWIEARLIDAIIDGFLANKHALAAAPTRGGRRGNPVLLGRGLFDAAMRLQGDEGARRLIGSLSAAELVEVEAPDAGVIVDIDTPTDLAAARQSRSSDP
jgi:molybdenum cofactor cytidylyltransferase